MRLAVLGLVVSGCATRTWTSGTKALGDPHGEPMDPTYYITAEPSEAASIAIVGEASEVPQTRMSQFYRTYESGRYDPKDAHLKGNYWLGFGAAGFVVPLFFVLNDPDTGEPIWEPGKAVTASLVIGVPLAIVGGAQHLAPSLPAVRRNSEKSSRDWVVEGTPIPAAGFSVDVLPGLGTVTVGPDGKFAIPMPALIPETVEVRLAVNGAPGPQTTVDLRTTTAWKEQEREEVRQMVAGGNIEAARTKAGAESSDPHLMAVYCDSVGGHVTDSNYAEVAKVFGGPLDFDACRGTWNAIVHQFVVAAAPVAGNAELMPQVLEPSLAVPEAVSGPIKAIVACSRAIAEPDPIVAWGIIGATSTEDSTAAECLAKVRSRREAEYEAAVARQEREDAAAAARCGGHQARRVAAFRQMADDSYTTALSKGLGRVRSDIQRRAATVYARGQVDESVQEMVECMARAGESANQIYRGLYEMVRERVEIGDDDSLDGYTVDAMVVALGKEEDQVCGAQMVGLLGAVAVGPMQQYLAAHKAAEKDGCD